MRKEKISFNYRGFVFTAIGLGFLFAFEPAVASEFKGILKNNEGTRKFQSERFQESYELFNQALIELPFSPEVHFNIANTFLTNKEWEKAIQEFDVALRSPVATDQVKFRSLFNSAAAAIQLKKTDLALDFYQKALEFEPDSVEVKTNIELLLQSQQGGEGEGEGDPKDNSDGKDGEGKKDPQKGPPQSQSKPKPKPFDSKELSANDVNKILEELKAQEDQIRSKFQREGAKDAPKGKDW